MRVFTSCVAQKYGEIKADISQINESSFDNTFNKWKELTKGKIPALDVYRGYSWEFIKSMADKVPIQIISAGYGVIDPDYLGLLNIPKQDNIILLNDYKLTRLSKWLGAGAHAIANRFTKFIVEEYPNISGDKELKELFNELDKKHGKALRTKRNSVTDEFIIEWANEDKTLTQLRDKGYSCSYQRFTRLQDKEWLKNNPDRKFTKQFKR